jgi:hypothetical protein
VVVVGVVVSGMPLVSDTPLVNVSRGTVVVVVVVVVAVVVVVVVVVVIGVPSKSSARTVQNSACSGATKTAPPSPSDAHDHSLSPV